MDHNGWDQPTDPNLAAAGAPDLSDPSGYANTQQYLPIPMHEHPGPTEADRVLVTVGDMAVTGTYLMTPGGPHWLRGTTWTMSNYATTSQYTPAWAIIGCFVFLPFCLFGLVFLLAKNTRTSGSVQVTVQGPGLFHTTQIPIRSVAQIAAAEQSVNYARFLVAHAR